MEEYPTKDQILSTSPGNIKEDIAIVSEWKSLNYKGWKDKTIKEKHQGLIRLIQELSLLHGHPCNIQINTSDYYDPETHTININDTKPSIVSALHEFGHHMFGESELKACSYSVWIFKTVFPKVFSQLKFEGHKIVK